MSKLTSILRTIGKDTLHVIEYPFVNTARFIEVLDDAIKDEPPVKAAIISLVAAAELAIGDTAAAAAERGINIPADLKVVTDAETFFAYFKNTFLPLVESAYKQIDAVVAPAV